ncbi:MAG: crosslink repair DNA glycosylase YcaQ family protein [Actinomycetes bacterium]
MSRSLSPTEISRDSARRIALVAQGFATPRPTGRIDRRHLRRVIDSVGLIQIDSVNVLVRSQEMPLFSRLGNHPRTLIPDATAAGELFEYWCHEASHLPVSMHPLIRWRMDEARNGAMWPGLRRIAESKPKLMKEIRDRIYNDGPLVAGDVRTRTGPKGSWWDWDDGKAVLEYLFWTGEITAQRRPNDFARVYYAPHDVLPTEILKMPTPSQSEARREMLLLAARSVGVGTAADLFDYHRQKPQQAKPYLTELVEEGLIEQVRVEGWRDPAYMLPDTLRPRSVDVRALVSPFDSLVWCRPRIERLFDFHYRIEIYVPAPKRVYGYYVLPFVLGDRIVARVDLKADRHAGELFVPGAFSEDNVDIKHVAAELMIELREMATWLGLDRVRIGTNGDLTTLLAKQNRQK